MDTTEDKVKVKVSGKLYALCPPDGHQIISKNHLPLLKGLYLRWTMDGYVLAQFKRDGRLRSQAFHRYLYEHVTNSKIPDGMVIHHRNQIRYDNSWNNLEVVTQSYNSTAIVSRKNDQSLSQYKGVSQDKKTFKWTTTIRNTYVGRFNTEIEAARRYDEAFLAIYGTVEGSNNLLQDTDIARIVSHKSDFLPKVREVKRDLPKYIRLHQGYFQVRVRLYRKQTFYTKNFKNLESAVKYRDEILKLEEGRDEQELKSKDIYRDYEGIALIPVKVHKSSEIVYAKVDDADYYQFSKYVWFLNPDGYALCTKGKMHLMILPSRKGHHVDHINVNKLDNRRCNLRYASLSLSSRNKRKRGGCSSQYTGVTWSKRSKKWYCGITIHGKHKHLGTFDNEEEAAQKYQEEYDRLVREDSGNNVV